jgi:hypothetical protein
MAKQSSARVSAQISSAAVAANEAFLMARYARAGLLRRCAPRNDDWARAEH